jgi:hypothetical protein
MKGATRVWLPIALVFLFVPTIVVGSNLIASHQADKLGLQNQEIVVAKAETRRVPATSRADKRIVVVRDGAPAITFTDASAVAYELTSVDRELRSFEVALGRDIAHGELRAPLTARETATAQPVVGGSTAEKFMSARRKLDGLEEALRRDLASGAFRAAHTRRLVRRLDSRELASAAGEVAVASGVVSVSDDLWDLEMAVEKDIHDGDLRADETHFVIDRRRWRVD